VTDLIDLEAGKFYKIKAQHKDFGGGYWASFAVEFMQPGSENHPMAAKAVQSWRIEQENTPETWTLEILNPSSTGTFKLSMKSPKQTTAFITDAIACNVVSGTLESRLNAFFNSSARAGSVCKVTRTMYDANGAVTTTTASAKKYVYTIKLVKRIDGFSFTAATVLPVGTITSTVTVNGPYATGG
jgi:hypothetical protein